MRALHIRIFIFVSLCFALFLFAPKVDALTWDMQYQTAIDIFNDGYSTCNYQNSSSGGTTADQYCNLDFKANFVNSNHYHFMIIPYTSTFFSHSDYGTGQWYMINSTFKIALRSPTYYSWCEIQNNFVVCPLRDDTTYTRLQVYAKLPTDSDGFNIKFSNFGELYNSYFYSLITSNSSISNTINNQTSQIENSDAPASATYNNDYSTNSFDAASNSVNQHTDINVSSLNLNTSGYSSSWSWLWSLSESFIANVKVFGAYIFMLTLGFIALVLGR